MTALCAASHQAVELGLLRYSVKGPCVGQIQTCHKSSTTPLKHLFGIPIHARHGCKTPSC
eukprot:8449768-Pyramimonas_sp.AAC.3